MYWIKHTYSLTSSFRLCVIFPFLVEQNTTCSQHQSLSNMCSSEIRFQLLFWRLKLIYFFFCFLLASQKLDRNVVSWDCYVACVSLSPFYACSRLWEKRVNTMKFIVNMFDDVIPIPNSHSTLKSFTIKCKPLAYSYCDWFSPKIRKKMQTIYQIEKFKYLSCFIWLIVEVISWKIDSYFSAHIIVF